jgi:hypothetical protein
MSSTTSVRATAASSSWRRRSSARAASESRLDPALVERARARAREAGVDDRVEFVTGDMYEADVSGATVVTLFLHPEPNLKLRPALARPTAAGARVVSYLWDMGDWKPDEVRTVNFRRRVFLWRISRLTADSSQSRAAPPVSACA